MKKVNESSYIVIKAKENQELSLGEFLIQGSSIVKETEKNTVLWSALKNDETFVIFDTFENNMGREEHFNGKVAALLNENATSLVEGGWEDGVVSNITNPKILAAKTSSNTNNSKIAVFISLTAKEGEEENLAQFLTAGAQIVKETEEKTLDWYALRFSNNKFGILDFFESQDGADAHFNGKVAALLNENANKLVKNGWEDGVLANIKSYEVLALIN